MMGGFHFQRPWWLLALLPCALLVRAIWRRGDTRQAWCGVIAPHLLPFLLQGESRRGGITPLHLIAVGWLIAVVAIAGPAWRHEPAPFADDTAALAIVVKVAPSMSTEDVQPSRLARAVQKIHDLLAQRPGAKTALIAYSGSVHVVMPLTTDGGIIETFAQALDPKIMPAEGDVTAEAFGMADAALASAGGGSILWITDSIAPEQGEALAAWRKRSKTPVRLLPPLLPGAEFDVIEIIAPRAGVSIVPLAADASDVASLARAAKFETATGGEKSDRWEESGFWLSPLLAALLLPFFRKGWMATTATQT